VSVGRTVFRDASGDAHENPDAAWLKDKLFNAGDDYWAGGSGEAVLNYWEGGEQKSKLLLTGMDDYGFMLHYNTYPKTEPDLVLTTGERTGETVEAVIGGEPIECRREYFVPKETAWQAVEHFLSGGGRKEDLHWTTHQSPESE
jgi:hypothetical protein